MEGEIREIAVKGRQVIGTLERIMNGRNVSIEAKRGIRSSIILPTLDICIRGVDMECSTTVMDTCSGDELRKRSMWAVKMGWREQCECV